MRHRAAKPFVFLCCLAPLIWLAAIGPDGWGANPVETFNRFLGDWALRFLLLTLSVSPLAQLSRGAALLRFRRMIGLFAFFYACLHLSSYVVFDQFFDVAAIWQDIVKRNFITVGMVSFVALILLAATSTNKAIRRMGARNWQKLHRLVYAIGIGAVAHNIMMVKANYDEALIHAAILAILLGWRIATRRSRSTKNAAKPEIAA